MKAALAEITDSVISDIANRDFREMEGEGAREANTSEEECESEIRWHGPEGTNYPRVA
jgi:hypothetical protein